MKHVMLHIVCDGDGGSGMDGKIVRLKIAIIIIRASEKKSARRKRCETGLLSCCSLRAHKMEACSFIFKQDHIFW